MPEVVISVEKITFGSMVDQQSVTITSNYEYVVMVDESWVTITDAESNVKGALTNEYLLESAANDIMEGRTAIFTVLVKYQGTLVATEIPISQVPGGETITSVSTKNTFSNGDVVEFDDTSIVNYIGLFASNSYESSTEVISEVREFYFNFETVDSNFDYTVTMTTPDGDGAWKLYQFDGERWCELEDAVYDASGATATIDLSHELQSDTYFYTSRLAFIDEDAALIDAEVVQNPSKRNALSALITFTTAMEVVPTMTLKGQDNNDIVHEFDSAKLHEIEVLGLYNSYDNTVYIDLELNQELPYRRSFTIRPEYPYIDDFVFNTEFDPDLNNKPDDIYVNSGPSLTGNTDYDEYGYLLFSMGIDQYGKLRWLYSDDPSEGKNLRIFPISYLGGNYLAQHVKASGSLNVFDYSGNRIVNHPGVLVDPHHEAVMGPGNTIIVPEIKEGSSSDQCTIREVDLTTGETISFMDLDEIIDPDRSINITSDSGDDRVHVNSIIYSESDDCYIISMRHQGLVKIKRGTTDSSGIVWWMTPHYDVAEEWQKYLLEPTNFENVPENWNLGQHSVSILPNGDIMMFDNHNEPLESADASYRKSRVWVVRVDDENLTIEHVNEWYDSSNTYCSSMSCAYYHDDTSTAVSAWSVLRSVYEVSYPDGKQLFKGEFKTTNTTASVYRIYKFNMYNR